VANWAAGKGDGEISMADIRRNLGVGMEKAKLLLRQVMAMDQ
jgi:hypothetical protein